MAGVKESRDNRYHVTADQVRSALELYKSQAVRPQAARPPVLEEIRELDTPFTRNYTV